MTTAFTNKHDNVRVVASYNSLNNTTSPLTIAIQSDLSALTPPFRLTAYSQASADPTSDPLVERMICTAVGSSTVTLTRANPVAHAGSPYLICAETAADWDAVQAAVNALEGQGGLPAASLGDLLVGDNANHWSAMHTSTVLDGYVLTRDHTAGPFCLAWAPVSMPGVPVGGSYDISAFAYTADTNWHTEGAVRFQSSDVNHVEGVVSYGDVTSSGAQNDEIQYGGIALPAGVYGFELTHMMQNARGIYTVYLDSTSIGTIDGYINTNKGAPNVISAIRGISVAGGTYTVKLKMATKNGDSTYYYGVIQHLRFVRTA